MKKNIVRFSSVLVSSSMICSSVLTDRVDVFADTTGNKSTIANNIFSEKYTQVSSGYTLPEYTGDDVQIGLNENNTSGDGEFQDPVVLSTLKDSKEYALEIGDRAEIVVNVPQDGIYYMGFYYYDKSDSILPIELEMKINGEYPFYESRRLIFESNWLNAETKVYDRYGNEVLSKPDKELEWNYKYVMDASYRYSEPLGIELKKGENRIELEVAEGNFSLVGVNLTSAVEFAGVESSEVATGDNLYVIEAEYPSYRNDSSVRALCEYDVALTPYNVKSRELNIIDGGSFKTAGQSVGYEVNVEEAGNYYIALNYKQSDKTDFPVFVDVRVDGSILNENFKDVPLDYNKGYVVKTLDDGEQYLSVYLEEGVHDLSFTISVDPVRHVIEEVEKIMSEINDLSLEITKVAGTNKDKYRDLDLETYIPGVGDSLFGYADKLDGLVESVRQYNPKVDQIGAFYSISVASSQLRNLAADPKELPYRMAELTTNSSSVTSYLATLLDELNRNRVSLDKIMVYQEDAELPSKPGFFKTIQLNISRFIASFSQQDYSAASAEGEALQVWVNRPRQYLEIMQKMIDEDFTAQTGIEVNLSLMPDQNKLVLANASGDAPDIATGINYAIPFELGIRGALVDLTEFEDFAPIVDRYTEGLLVPSTIEDGIYSLPETRNFYVLYYRTDILEKLGLEKPETMDDVRNMLPELQMRGLNFYYPTAGMSMKNFHGTTPLLFQNGATLYGEYAGDTTINSEEAVQGFTELTELFTIYNAPKDVPSFYQHFRNGDIPLGISDFGVYNLLTNAAPEIANSWEIALIPGVEDENGDILRYSAGGADSTVMFKSDSDREAKAWEFMKWWSSAKVQSDFGQTLQITYGDEYIWNTANIEAFATLPIRTEDKKVIVEQDQWIMESPRILGTYMLERELSNAYNSVVVDGENLRITLDNAVKRIDRETERKLEEFGYIKDGKVVENYTVPTIETVREIIENSK